jgi:type IV secretion system protein VirD4
MAAEQESQRPLLTADECMRLPGAQKSQDGQQIIAPGDMLLMVAGYPPIYGKQILYFKDPIFDRRSKIPAPESSDRIIHIERKSIFDPVDVSEKKQELEPVLSTPKTEVIEQDLSIMPNAISPVESVSDNKIIEYTDEELAQMDEDEDLTDSGIEHEIIQEQINEQPEPKPEQPVAIDEQPEPKPEQPVVINEQPEPEQPVENEDKNDLLDFSF